MKKLLRILLLIAGFSFVIIFILPFVIVFSDDISIDVAELCLEAHAPHILQQATGEYISRSGDRQAGLFLIRYIRDLQPSDKHEAVQDYLKRIIGRYPDHKEEYISYIVTGIMNEDTSVYGREHLFYLLEWITGAKFDYFTWVPRTLTFRICGIEIEGTAEYSLYKSDVPDPEAIVRVRDWWIDRMNKLPVPGLVE